MHNPDSGFEVHRFKCDLLDFCVQFEKTTRMSRETEDRLKAIPNFCFPDAQDWRPSADINRLDYKPHFRVTIKCTSESRSCVSQSC